MCSCNVSKEGISLEEAKRVLAAHGYRCMVRCGNHVHGIQYHQPLFSALEHEDERHLCLLESLVELTPAAFLALVQETFLPVPHTMSPVAFSPFLQESQVGSAISTISI